MNNFIYPLMHFSNEACDILENELQKAIFSLSGRRFRVLFLASFSWCLRLN